jgi:fluoride exporter
MTPLVLVAVGSMIGAVLRYLLDREIQRRRERVFPLGTLVVNVSGSLALGLVVGVASSGGMSALQMDALGTGLIGAYTTFSTFTWETLRMLEEGSFVRAAANVVGGVGGGLAAVAIGFWVTTLG